MKRSQNLEAKLHLLVDSSQSDCGGLLKAGISSLFLHIILIIFLIFNLKTIVIKDTPPVYRVTIKPLSLQGNSKLQPLEALSMPVAQPIPEKPQMKKEENRPKEEVKQSEPIREEVRQSKPVEEPKQLSQRQMDENTVEKPIPLPMAETSTLKMDSSLDGEDEILPPSAVVSSVESNISTSSVLSAGNGTGAGSGTGTGTGAEGFTPGGSTEGERTAGGSRWGGSREGKGRGSSSWSSSGKEPGEGGGIPGFRGSGTGTGTGTGIGSGTGTGAITGTWTGKGKGGQLGGSMVGRSGVSSPGYAENPKPVYPLEARQKGFEGEVLLKVEVLPNGRVGEVELEKSSGHEILDQSAIDTIKKWRFIPARKGGVAIPCWVNIPFKFQLREISF